MMTLRRRCAPAVLAAAVVLTGCTSSGGESAEAAAPGPSEAAQTPAPRILQPGAPGEPSREVTAEEAASAGDVEHNDADVTFMQDMLPHHAQALQMTAMVGARTQREDLPLFARRMDISQDDEMAQIERWLEVRDEPVPDADAGPDHGGMDGMDMPGMLTEEELTALEAAEGEEFDRLFLESMIRHHEGALAMVSQLLEDEGGQETEIFQFVNHVDSDQRIEITRMQQMLAEIDSAG